jgi:hypothetical protein
MENKVATPTAAPAPAPDPVLTPVAPTPTTAPAAPHLRDSVRFEKLPRYEDLSTLCSVVLKDLETFCFDFGDQNRDQLKQIILHIALEIQKSIASSKSVRLCLLPTTMRQFNINLGKRYVLALILSWPIDTIRHVMHPCPYDTDIAKVGCCLRRYS